MSDTCPDTVPADWQSRIWSPVDLPWDLIQMTPLFDNADHRPVEMLGPAYALVTLLKWDGAAAIDGPRSLKSDEPACLIVPVDRQRPRFAILLPRGRQLLKIGGRADHPTTIEGVWTAWSGDDVVYAPDEAIVVAAHVALHGGLTGRKHTWVERPVRTFGGTSLPVLCEQDDDDDQ